MKWRDTTLLLLAVTLPSSVLGCRGRNVRAVKVTTGNIFSIALPLERYARENGRLPRLERGDADRLRVYLEPRYIRKLPTQDGWGHAVQVRTQANGYSIWSRGRDGVDDGKWTLQPTGEFDCDIVYQNRRFVQYPDGVSAVESYEISEAEIR